LLTAAGWTARLSSIRRTTPRARAITMSMRPNVHTIGRAGRQVDLERQINAHRRNQRPHGPSDGQTRPDPLGVQHGAYRRDSRTPAARRRWPPMRSPRIRTKRRTGSPRSARINRGSSYIKHEFNPPAFLMPLSPATRLGPYEIVSSIGARGMGEVLLRARHQA
jgi:hypothetical protein